MLPIFIFHYKQKNFLAQLVCFLGIASNLFFIGVGIFPLTNITAHTFTAGLFFVTMAMTIIIALIEFLKNNYKKKKFYYSTKFLFHFISLFAIALIIAYLLNQAPIWQKLAVLSIGIWLVDWIFIK